MATSSISIKELGGEGRLIVLQGAALPKQGSASWGAKQRVITTWYPGNAAMGTQQIIGPTEAQTQWSGEWNTNRIINTPVKFTTAASPGSFQSADASIFSADDVRALLEDFFRSGLLLRVIWTYDPNRLQLPKGAKALRQGLPPSTAGSYNPVEIVRNGRAVEWDFKYSTGDDIEWSITWEWQSRGPTMQEVVNLRSGSSSTKTALLASQFATESASKIIEENIVFTRTRTVPLGASKFTLGQIQALADQIRRQVRLYSQQMNKISSAIANVTEIVNTTANLPFEIANQAIDLATNMIAESNRLYDATTKTPTELYDTEQRYTTFLRAMNFAKGATDTSQQVADQGAESQSVFRAQTQAQRASGEQGNAQPLGVRPGRQVGGTNTQTQAHVVRRGDTLISISVFYYGTPDGVADIAFANGISLRTPTLPIGRVLIIPPPRDLGGNVVGVPRLPLQPSATLSPTQPNGVGSSPNTP